jgi:hypothetical protein
MHEVLGSIPKDHKNKIKLKQTNPNQHKKREELFFFFRVTG